MMFAVLAGLFLSWFQVEGLRRNASKLLNGQTQESRRWAMAFGLRWGAFALMLWVSLHLFKNNLAAFLIAFVLSGILMRAWVGRNAFVH